MKYFILILAILIFSTAHSFAEDSRGALFITVKGFKTDKGNAILELYNSRAAFMKQDKTFLRLFSAISNHALTIVLSNIPYGNYVIAITHDENTNGRMDYNFLGFPAEGFGFSNGDKLFGPPSFDALKFDFETNRMDFAVKMMYF